MTRLSSGPLAGLGAACALLIAKGAFAQDRIVPGKAPAVVGSSLAVTCVDPSTGAPNACNGGGGGSSGLKAQSSPQTYVAGTTNTPDGDLHGSTRVIPTDPTGATIDLTTAQPVTCPSGCTVNGTATVTQGAAGPTPWLVTGRNAAGYSAAVTALAPAASATDVFTIAGSASKTIKIVRIRASCIATAANVADMILLKRSSADTAGASTTPTNVPMDSLDAAGTAAVKAYTANPTTGTLVGALRADKITCSTAASPAVQSDIIIYGDGSQNGGRPITLRGTAEQLALNLNGATITGGAFNISVEWTEE